MYFEIYDPYYALIEANSKERAISIYENDVTYFEDEFDSDEILEVSIDYASQKYLECMDAYDDDTEKLFIEHKDAIILIDRDLI